MIFTETAIPGAYIVEPELLADARGFFARTWCQREFEAHGLGPHLAQCNISFNAVKGTIRGLHYQAPPCEEAKLIRCTSGAIYDVLVDIRPGSPMFARWSALELTADNHRMLYIPEGVAHGFQTLDDNTEVFYQMSERYHANAARGMRWNDPAFAICWPLDVSLISDRDQSYPDHNP